MTRTRNSKVTALVLAGVVVGMVGLAFASVPLYRLFCQVTGYGGTTRVADAAAVPVSERTIKVRFDANVNHGMPWVFQPAASEVTVRLGEEHLAFFKARNRGDKTIVGTATFNVTPYEAGPYFNKVQCFCFTEQHLDPGEEAEMPVTFYVDPAIATDPNTQEIRTVTLSYTFFRATGNGAGAAAESGETAPEPRAPVQEVDIRG